MAAIQPFRVMEVMERAHRLEAAGRSIIHMEIGQPNFGAPPQVIEAAVLAMQTHSLGYSATLGIAELRAALASFYEQCYGVSVSPRRIAITAGASAGLLLALGLLIDPGDEVLMPDPCYPCNPNFVRLYDGVPVYLPVGESQGYQPTLPEIKRCWTSRTKGILLASPSNPTGSMISKLEMGAIANWVGSQGGFVLVDEIYQGLVYGSRPKTALAASQESWIINSFSKYFGMTGWRLGWMVIPEDWMSHLEKLAQNLFICPSTPAQYAALAAFRPATLALLEERRAELQRRRDFLVPELRGLGFSIPLMPSGAFYVYAGCGAFNSDSSDLAWRLLEEAGVAITPGRDFGSHLADRHVRFAYTQPKAELEEGIGRMRKLLR